MGVCGLVGVEMLTPTHTHRHPHPWPMVGVPHSCRSLIPTVAIPFHLFTTCGQSDTKPVNCVRGAKQDPGQWVQMLYPNFQFLEAYVHTTFGYKVSTHVLRPRSFGAIHPHIWIQPQNMSTWQHLSNIEVFSCHLSTLPDTTSQCMHCVRTMDITSWHMHPLSSPCISLLAWHYSHYQV